MIIIRLVILYTSLSKRCFVHVHVPVRGACLPENEFFVLRGIFCFSARAISSVYFLIRFCGSQLNNGRTHITRNIA